MMMKVEGSSDVVIIRKNGSKTIILDILLV